MTTIAFHSVAWFACCDDLRHRGRRLRKVCIAAVETTNERTALGRRGLYRLRPIFALG